MLYWTREFLKLQLGAAAVFAVVLSFVPLTGNIFSAGPQIAFESDRDGNWEIYLLDVDRSLDVNLTRSPADERAPSWSPDGRALVFYSDRDTSEKNDIYILDVTKGQVQRLTQSSDNNWMPAWSPDGHHIVYVMNFGNMIIVDADGSNPHGLGFGFRPSWSADGLHVVFYGDPQNDLNHEIYDIGIKTFAVLNLSQNLSTDWDPAWSPDGRQIAFASVRGSNSDIFLMDVCAGSDTAPCARAAHSITHNRAADMSPAWSPDSRQIAYTSEVNGNAGIFIVDVDGKNMRSVIQNGANNRSPAWRPQ